MISLGTAQKLFVARNGWRHELTYLCFRYFVLYQWPMSWLRPTSGPMTDLVEPRSIFIGNLDIMSAQEAVSMTR